MASNTERNIVFTDYDSFLFHQGTNYEVYRKLGAHPGEAEGVEGTWFNVWAPNAQYVSVITAKTGWENEQWMHRSAGDGGPVFRVDPERLFRGETLYRTIEYMRKKAVENR